MTHPKSQRQVSLPAAILLVVVLPILSLGPSGVAAQGSNNSHPGSLDARGTACCAQLTAVGFTTALPVLIVNTRGKQVNAAIPVDLCTCDAPKPGEDFTTAANIPAGANKATMEHRGGQNSNQANVLRSYNIKLANQAPFLGLPSEKNYLIYQPQNDTLGLRQWAAFNLSRDTGEYNPRQTYFEMFINTAGSGAPLNVARDYVGLELALQKVIRDKKAVDIPKTKSTTSPMEAGYIFEYEHGQVRNGTVAIVGNTTRQPWNIRYPKQANISPAQQSYVDGYLNQFEKALYGPAFTNPATGWRAYGNETTFVDWFLEAELLKNTKHSYHGAVYMYKNGSGPLLMGSQWAMSQAFGFCCGYPIEGYKTGGVNPLAPGKAGGSAIAPQGWLFNICDDQARCVSDPTLGLSVWFRQLWQDPEFRTAAARRFLALRAGPWSAANVGARFDRLQAYLRPAGLRTLNKYVPLGIIWQAGQYPSVPAGYDSKFAELRAWVLARLAFMESQLSQVAAGTIPPQLTPEPVNLAVRSRAEGDFATGAAAVRPNTTYVAPPLAAADSAGG